MRAIDSRLSRLENQLGPKRGGPRYLLIAMQAGQELGPAENAYLDSLDKAGLLPNSGFGLVDLLDTSNRSAVNHGDATPEIAIELL